eukprot:scaffold8753_cov128-Isochrysis_galbana.AAC.3
MTSPLSSWRSDGLGRTDGRHGRLRVPRFCDGCGLHGCTVYGYGVRRLLVARLSRVAVRVLLSGRSARRGDSALCACLRGQVPFAIRAAHATRRCAVRGPVRPCRGPWLGAHADIRY